MGYFGTRDSSTEGQIHHGADDNASGTAVVMQVAERMARSNPKPARTVIFVAFSAEDLGLQGSRRYVDHPPVPLSTTKAMLNLDMVGRLKENRLTVFGTHSAKELSGIVTEEARRLGLEVRESDGVGRSDQMSFYNRKIPSLHFFTGSHPDYHRPTDTWDKVNADGMVKVSDLVLATGERIANMREPLNFVSLPSRPPSTNPGETRSYGVYLGSIPDMGESEDGVKFADIRVGSPAELAGLKQGDVMITWNGEKISNLYDFTHQLQNSKVGDKITITVTRGGQKITKEVTLTKRP